ncbi:MAG: hypothetical protein ACE5HN_09650 [Nitrospiria bacterium]
MAKQPVCLKLETSELAALGVYAKDRGLSRSAAGRALILRGLGRAAEEASIRKLIDRLGILETRTRRAQIAAYRAYAGVIEIIQVIARNDADAEQMIDSMVRKSRETLKKEEARGDYR